jgi:hypothetical protein
MNIILIGLLIYLLLVNNDCLDEAFGDLMNQTFQNSSEPNLLFDFNFSFLKPNQRFGAGQLPNYISKYYQSPTA